MSGEEPVAEMSLMSAIDCVRELTCDVADCGRIYCVAINTLIKYALAEADHAADLLDAQAEYDNNTELQETLERSSNSETVIRNRQYAGED